MSTSSDDTADSSKQYMTLACENAKLQGEMSVLKMLLLDEKAKYEDQQYALESLEAKMRKVVSENESLVFRNAQLVKRVEALQATLDNNNAAFLNAKNKKKHKEANLRLFGESSRQQAFNPVDPMLVMEQELERKLAENSELHSKIFDMEKQHESMTIDFTTRIEQLERENVRLKQLIEVRGVCTSLKSYHNSRPSSSNGEEDALHARTSSNATESSADDTLTDAPTTDVIFDENHLMEGHFFEKLENLKASLRYATGRAEYFKQECECLIQRSIIELESRKTLEEKVGQLEKECAQLNESLETTRQNYESQMRGLYEHMAEQDARIVEQSDRLLNGDNSDYNNGHTDNNNGGTNSRKTSMKRENGTSVGKVTIE